MTNPATTFQQPLISVDTVTLRLHGKKVQVLLVERWNEPYAGMLAIPGVLLGTNESIMQAAARAIIDKAEIPSHLHRGFEQLRVFDETNRDPRGATISVACLTFIEPEAEMVTSGTWVDVDSLPTLPFDHLNIINAALEKLQRPSESIIWGVVGDFFTTGQYSTMVLNAGGEVDRSNLVRAIPARLEVQKLTNKINGRNQTLWSLQHWAEKHRV